MAVLTVDFDLDVNNEDTYAEHLSNESTICPGRGMTEVRLQKLGTELQDVTKTTLHIHATCSANDY